MVHINDLWLAEYGIFHLITSPLRPVCLRVCVLRRCFSCPGPGGAAISLCSLQTINSLIQRLHFALVYTDPPSYANQSQGVNEE